MWKTGWILEYNGGKSSLYAWVLTIHRILNGPSHFRASFPEWNLMFLDEKEYPQVEIKLLGLVSLIVISCLLCLGFKPVPLQGLSCIKDSIDSLCNALNFIGGRLSSQNRGQFWVITIQGLERGHLDG